MDNCRFCSGKWVNGGEIGEGIPTMFTSLRFLGAALGVMEEKETEYDGIHLVDGNKLAFDNSSGEYAEQMLEINYCPFCGKKLEPKEGT